MQTNTRLLKTLCAAAIVAMAGWPERANEPRRRCSRKSRHGDYVGTADGTDGTATTCSLAVFGNGFVTSISTTAWEWR